MNGKSPGTLEDLLKQVAERADFQLRSLSEAVEGRKMEMVNALVSNAYPYVSVLRSFQDEYELPEEWDTVVDGFWNDFQYLKEMTMQLQR